MQRNAQRTQRIRVGNLVIDAPPGSRIHVPAQLLADTKPPDPPFHWIAQRIKGVFTDPHTKAAGIGLAAAIPIMTAYKFAQIIFLGEG